MFRLMKVYSLSPVYVLHKVIILTFIILIVISHKYGKIVLSSLLKDDEFVNVFSLSCVSGNADYYQVSVAVITLHKRHASVSR